MKRVLVVGEPLVELLAEPSGIVRDGFGGDALNLAVYLARESPELQVMLASAVGDDRESHALLALCRDEGIDESHIRRLTGAGIGRYRVTVDRSGERAFEYQRSGTPFRDALDDDDAMPDPHSVDVLCFSGITVAVLHDAGRRTLFDYAQAVRRAGGMCVYDPNHRPPLWADDGDAREWTTRIAPIADVFLASTEDGRRLTDEDTAQGIARAFRALGAREVVVTDGSDPCVVMHDAGVIEIPATDVGAVVDTTAAGDAFDAGYVAARLRGDDPERSARAGHRLASTVVAERGALMPRRD